MKYTGPVRFIFSGNKEVCSKYTGRARLYLQQAIDRMGSDKAAIKKVEPDGTTIRIVSFHSGYNVEITCPGEEIPITCTSGFYLEPVSTEAPLGFRPDRTTPIESEDGFFPGITVDEGEITQDNVEFKGAAQPYVLDWTSPEFDDYLVWPADYLKTDSDANSTVWIPFHRYYCKPATGKLYYCNEEHSGGPGGLALGYGIRTINKKKFLYCAASTDGVNINVHRRLWTEVPYENDDELHPTTNPFGWELIGTVEDLQERGYPANKWSSGAYWDMDCDKFVISVHRDNEDTPGGYIEVDVEDYGIITVDTQGLVDYDYKNGTFRKTTEAPDPFPNTGPWNADYWNHGGDLSVTPTCAHASAPSHTLKESGDAAWIHEDGGGNTYYSNVTSTSTNNFDYDTIVLGADYNYDTNEKKTIDQVSTSGYDSSGSYYTSSGSYSRTTSLVDCSASCGGIWRVDSTYSGNWKRWTESKKFHNTSYWFNGSPSEAYKLESYGNKTGNGTTGGEWWQTGNRRTFLYNWSCGGTYPTSGQDTGKQDIFTLGTITFECNHILYLDMRYDTYIIAKGLYETADQGLTYTSSWTLDINNEIQETFDVSPYSIHSSDVISGYDKTAFPGTDDNYRQDKWEYGLVPEFTDNLAWHTLGNVFTNKNKEIIAMIPTYSIRDDLAWNGAVWPDQSAMRLYYTPHQWDTLEELGYSGTNLTVSRIRLV